MRFTRIASLGWRQLVLNRLRWTMLTATTVTALLVFLVMHALSNASTNELDDAVQATLGYESTYTIDVPNDLAAPILDTAEVIGRIVRGGHPAATVTFVDLPDVLERCPDPAESEPTRDDSTASTETPRLIVILDFAGSSTLIGGKHIAPAQGSWCLDGIRVDGLQEAHLGPFISGAIGDQSAPILLGREHLERAMSGRPSPASITNLSVLPDDRAPEHIRTKLVEALGPPSLRAGQAPGWTNTIDVHRADTGEALRDAGKSVQLVYRLIGLAVLGVGAAALLVAQLMTSQTRAWFYALTVAWGARRRDIIALAASEVCVIVVISLSTTLAIAAAADASISHWTVQQFGQEMHIFDPSMLAGLVIAAGAIILAATVPATIAVARTDPLDVLE